MPICIFRKFSNSFTNKFTLFIYVFGCHKNTHVCSVGVGFEDWG